MQLEVPCEVEVFRGRLRESVHQVAFAVVDEKGSTVFSRGLLESLVFPRSSIKFLQAIPFVETGAFQAYSLSSKHLALACASHQAEAFHLEILSTWMTQLQLQDNDLACGPQLSSHKPTADAVIQQRKPLTRLMNNCSGKHLGMLTTALFKKEPLRDYQLAEHPVQKRIAGVLQELSGFDFSKATYGVDGCGIPTYAAPLKTWAIAMVKMLDPRNSPERAKACQAILEAVRQYPELVSGSEHMDLKIHRLARGKIILKSGAEGFCNGLLPEKGLAFAIKVLDGQARAIPSVILGLLQSHGDLPQEMMSELTSLLSPEIKNTRQDIVGHIALKEKI